MVANIGEITHTESRSNAGARKPSGTIQLRQRAT
jgi:hypothetical protein